MDDVIITPFTIFAMFTLLAMIGLAGWYLYTRVKRVSNWKRWAGSVGWVYRRRYNEGPGLASVHPMGTGHGLAWHLAEGIYDSLPAATFGYGYVIGHSDSVPPRFQIVRLVVPGARFPRLIISRERTLQLPGRDIEFENAAFNAQWRVHSESRRFAHDALHQRTMEWLASYPYLPLINVWFEGNSIFVAVPHLLGPEHVQPYLDLLSGLARSLPPFVLAHVGVQAGLPAPTRRFAPRPA